MSSRDTYLHCDKVIAVLLVSLVLVFSVVSSHASTVAYWRFEAGLDGAAVPDTAGKTSYQIGINDVSGNGNVLCAWNSTHRGQIFNAEVAQATIPATGQANQLSLQGGKFSQVTHRYSFNVDGQAEDSVGTADLTLTGTAAVSGGLLDLSGVGTRVNNATALGASLTELADTINGSDAVTMEAWFSLDTAYNWNKLMMLGQGEGDNYMDMTTRRGGTPYTPSCSINDGPSEVHAVSPAGTQLAVSTDYYMAAIWDELSDSLTVIIAEAADPSTAVFTSADMGGKDLASIIINEFYLGSAVQFGDSDLDAQIDEFRIYDAALSPVQITANIAAGPDTVTTAEDSGRLFTWSSQSNPAGADLQSITPLQWTIEATVNVRRIDGFQTFLGRDGASIVNGDSELAPLSFQVVPDGRVQIAFADLDGNYHRLYSQQAIQARTWYHFAAVSDAATLSLYINDRLDNSISLSSVNAALAKASDDESWTLLCGMFNSMAGDYFDGLIDEVRISDAALSPYEFLFWETPAGELLSDRQIIVLSEVGPTFREIELSLAFEPLADVTVTLEDAAATDQVVLSDNNLVFTPSNWSIPHTVTVTAVDDTAFEALNHFTQIDAAMSSSDPSYNRLQSKVINVSIGDNDCGHWGYVPGDIDTNCVVNIDDLVEMATYWMDCTLPDTPGCISF